MRITDLTLRDLRRYKDTDLELAPGLTIVRGPNEAGKSTIQRAIELALTRKVTSSAADLDGLQPWDGDADARTSIGLGFTWEDEDGGAHEGRLEKSFRGEQGRGPPRARRRRHHRPGAGRRAARRAVGRPDRGLLPLDGLDPPPRAGRAPARRGRAPGPPPGVDLRRRPRHEPRPQEARPRAVRAPDEGREEPGPPQDRGRRGDRRHARSSRRARTRCRASSATATRSRSPASVGPSPTRRSSSAGRCSRRRARPSGSTRRRTPAQERYERYRTGGHRPRRDHRARPDAPVADAAPRAQVHGRAAARRSTADRDPHGDARGRGPGQLRGPARGPLAAAVALGARPGRASASSSPSRRSSLTFIGSSTSAPCRCSSAARSRSIGLALAVVGFWLRRGDTRPDASSRTPRSTAGSAAGRRSSRSCARRPAERDDLLSRLGLETSEEAEARLAAEEAHVAEIETAARPPRRG